ncbi:MAG: small subunit ribosomal protein S16 [Candidatus Peregrinibacteria bacterium Gr01-1014_25]|nr:MAG: small subunit ribosomal protein S16 [Candidatus Peregrinibacteria bacterium Gr01-1014_25]
MLMIRLQRTGRENVATYRVVIAEKSAPVKGKFQEIVGHYRPQDALESFTVEKARIEHWVKNGATPTDTVARLLKRTGFDGMERFIRRYPKRKPKGEEPEAPAASAAPAPAPTEAQPAPTPAPAEEPAPPPADTQAAAS